MFATMVCLRVRAVQDRSGEQGEEHTSARVEYVFAGHLPVLRYSATGGIAEVQNENLPLGITHDETFRAGVFTASRGDTVTLVTDGLIEVMNDEGRELGFPAIRDVFNDVASLAPADICEAIFAAARAHGVQRDDQSVVVVRVQDRLISTGGTARSAALNRLRSPAMTKPSARVGEKVAMCTAGTVGAIVLGALFGVFGGAAGYTAHYANATSYLSDDPKACINCHIMNDQYNSWSSSPHHARATCNDCHVPHDSMAAKYYVKAEHGYRHSKGFTFQDFHEPIRITKASRDVVIDNCVRCHEAVTHEIRTAASGRMGSEPAGGLDCIRCHASVAHGATR